MPQIPNFFYDGSLVQNTAITLDPDTSKHIWQVLRMEADDDLAITDGKGTIADGKIHIAERHKCSVLIKKVSKKPRTGNALHLGVAFTKNNSRNEWLLEKATELGVHSIIPLSTLRSEKTHVRLDRWKKILQSAILQSQQYYLPELTEVTPLKKLMELYKGVPQKIVAHCINDTTKTSLHRMLNHSGESIVLIGPEGDFTEEEVDLCKTNGYKSISLGAQRLRTETAAIAVAAHFNLLGDEKN